MQNMQYIAFKVIFVSFKESNPFIAI